MFKQKKLRKNFRRIVVGSQHWQWMCGKLIVVAYNDETGEKRTIKRSEITGVSEYDIEHSLWKGGSWFVGPNQVAHWLSGKMPTFRALPEKNVMERTYERAFCDVEQLQKNIVPLV